MADEGEISPRDEVLARLAETRAQIRQVLEPPRRETEKSVASGVPAGENFSTFPRSRTMRTLLSGRGIGTAGAVVGGLLLARPALALRLLRMIPAGAVARMLLVKALASFRARP